MAIRFSNSSPELWNPDLAPTDPSHRTWTAYHYMSLWIGMVMCIPCYMLAAGLIDQGFSAWQAVGMVLAGNAIVLVPMLLNGHAGAKFAIPFAVLVRTSFGVKGAKLPAFMRAVVACGWFGIQCWVGGSAIYAVGNIVTGGALVGSRMGWIGIDAGQLGSFILFWALHLYFIARGPESVRWIESISARSHGKPTRQSPLASSHSAYTAPTPVLRSSPATLKMMARRHASRVSRSIVATDVLRWVAG